MPPFLLVILGRFPYTRARTVALPAMLCYNTGMKTNVYACYLPGSTAPDYIGSHAAEVPERKSAQRWRYAHCVYLGAGAWLCPDGRLDIPRICKEHSAWAQHLMTLAPEALRAIRIDILATVEPGERWKAEARAIRHYRPPFNRLQPQTEIERKVKFNAYHRAYRTGYYARNPDKAARKREADKLRARAKRALAKEAVA